MPVSHLSESQTSLKGMVFWHSCHAVVRSGNLPLKEQWINYGKACVAPGLQPGELSESLAAFKAARLVCPQKTVEMQPNSQNLDAMQALPFLKKPLLDNLKKELSRKSNRFD